MIDLNFIGKIIGIICIQLFLLLLVQKLNFKKFVNPYQGVQKLHDGNILRIGGLFLFLPMILIFFITDEFKLESFYLIVICSAIIIFLLF